MGEALPLKILIWKYVEEVVVVGLRGPQLLANNYNFQGCREVLQKANKAMIYFALAAASYGYKSPKL